jgi:hypothetical protein
MAKASHAGGTDLVAPLLELHYDYEVPVQEGHPAFHAQLGKYDWKELELNQIGWNRDIQRNQQVDAYGNVRIPTPYMGYGAVLVAISADHMKPNGFRRVVRGLRETVLPQIEFDCRYLSDAVIAKRLPCAHEWYDRRYHVKLAQNGTKTYTAKVRAVPEEFTADTEGDVKGKVMKHLGVELRDLCIEGP